MKQPIYWDQFDRAAVRRQCGCKARGKSIIRALGDGIVLALLIGIIALTLYMESV